MRNVYPVDYAGQMEVFDTAEHLIEQVRHPLVIQIHLNHLTEVGIHQLHDQIDIRKFTDGFLWCEGVEQTNDLYNSNFKIKIKS